MASSLYPSQSRSRKNYSKKGGYLQSHESFFPQHFTNFNDAPASKNTYCLVSCRWPGEGPGDEIEAGAFETGARLVLGPYCLPDFYPTHL